MKSLGRNAGNVAKYTGIVAGVAVGAAVVIPIALAGIAACPACFAFGMAAYKSRDD